MGDFRLYWISPKHGVLPLNNKRNKKNTTRTKIVTNNDKPAMQHIPRQVADDFEQLRLKLDPTAGPADDAAAAAAAAAAGGGERGGSTLARFTSILSRLEARERE